MSPLRRALEPLITPFFRLWWRMNRGMTLGVRGLVTDAEGRVLLVRHTYTAGWFLPGGGVEKDETAAHALGRELAEEGGVEVTAPMALVGVYSNHPLFRNDHVVLYRVTEWRPCPHASEGEIAERGFFALDALPEGVSKGTRARLAEVFEGAAHSHYWSPQ